MDAGARSAAAVPAIVDSRSGGLLPLGAGQSGRRIASATKGAAEAGGLPADLRRNRYRAPGAGDSRLAEAHRSGRARRRISAYADGSGGGRYLTAIEE